MPNSVSDRAVISEETSPAAGRRRFCHDQQRSLATEPGPDHPTPEYLEPVTGSRTLDGALGQLLLNDVNLFRAKSARCHP